MFFSPERNMSSDTDDLDLFALPVLQEDAGFMVEFPGFYFRIEAHGTAEDFTAALVEALRKFAHILIHPGIHADLIPLL